MLSTPTLLLAFAVSRTWMAGVRDSCWCPGWSHQNSDHLLDAVWQSSLSPVSLESRRTCAFFALSVPARNQSSLFFFFFWSCLDARVVFLYLTCDSESLQPSQTQSSLALIPRKRKHLLLPDSIPPRLSSSARVVLTAHVLSDSSKFILICKGSFLIHVSFYLFIYFALFHVPPPRSHPIQIPVC